MSSNFMNTSMQMPLSLMSILEKLCWLWASEDYYDIRFELHRWCSEILPQSYYMRCQRVSARFIDTEPLKLSMC